MYIQSTILRRETSRLVWKQSASLLALPKGSGLMLQVSKALNNLWP